MIQKVQKPPLVNKALRWDGESICPSPPSPTPVHLAGFLPLPGLQWGTRQRCPQLIEPTPPVPLTQKSQTPHTPQMVPTELVQPFANYSLALHL